MPSSKGPVVVLGLLVTMLGLSLGAIALIIYFNANRPDSAAIAAACKGEVGAAIAHESDKVTAACEAAAAKAGPKTVAVPETAQHPGFAYPAGWSAFGKVYESNPEVHVTYLDPKFIDFSCAGCDGPLVSITMTTEPKKQEDEAITKAGSLKAYIESRFPDRVKPLTIVESTINGFPVVVVTGPTNEMIETSWEEKVIYAGAKNWVWINAASFGPSTSQSEVEKAWPEIKDSLNFSKIE